MFESLPSRIQVLIIGAGPAGSAMASWLANNGVQSLLVEKSKFPRFTIGESLLPEAINCLEAAGLLAAVESKGYQYKDGATFATNNEKTSILFSDGRLSGKEYAYQVPRDDFDDQLVRSCISNGVLASFQTGVSDILPTDDGFNLTLEHRGLSRNIRCDFLVDASGFAKVLAKRFGLDRPSGLANKKSMFSHFKANIKPRHFDKNKILIAQADMTDGAWYWVIPFSNGNCSIGVVTDGTEQNSESGIEQDYRRYLARQDIVRDLTQDWQLLRGVGCIGGYSSSISTRYGNRYVILGNAGEFIDPIFSSGVTIALKSAMLAAPLVRETLLHDRQPDWDTRFERPLTMGIETFKEYVKAWYNGTMQKLIYAAPEGNDIYPHICKILAGYAWERTNPMARITAPRLASLTKYY